MPDGVEVLDLNGWELVRCTAAPIQVDVVPGKGADILAVRWLPSQVNLLWESPWGLRARGAAPLAGDSVATWLAHYPGGWQVIFPNGGTAATAGGVEQGFHGEACLAPWRWERVDSADGVALRLETELTRSPFALRRDLVVTARGMEIVESAINLSPDPQEAMWSHHPAFGAPFISGTTRFDCGAREFVADDERDMPDGDLRPGATSAWPYAETRDGGRADLRRLPDAGDRLDRFGYLTSFAGHWAEIDSPDTGLRARLEWDGDAFPHAWLWLEANATASFPWFRRAYVFAIEPASSYPGQGIEAARAKTGTVATFAGHETRTTRINLSVTASGRSNG